MSLKNVEGIVINSSDFEDFAQIITIFSKELGKIILYAPGIRKTISKNKYSVQLFCKSNFDIFMSNNIEKFNRLKTGIIINQYENIAKDYTSYLYTQTVCEIIDKSSEMRLPDIETYNILETMINNINNEEKKFASYVFALFYLTKITGNKIILDRCVKCRIQKRIYRRFDYKLNGIICSNCLLNNENSQTPSFVDIFFDLNRLNYYEILQKKYNFIDLIALHVYLINFYENEVGLYIRSIVELKKTAAAIVPNSNIIDYI